MNYKTKSLIVKKKAFTLIELLIVIAIIGILFIVLVSKVDFATDKAKATGVQTDFRSFQMAFDTVAKENAGFNTFGWDIGDLNQDGIRNSYDEGDNGAGGGTAKNGIQDGAEVFTGHKVYDETFTKVFSLKKANADGTLEDNYDREALNRLETAINANLDPKLHITIKDDGEIVMANGAQDPWNKECHGWYITNAEADGKDRGAIVMYSDGANNEFGSEHKIANGVVSISIPGNNKYGKDDYSIVSCYSYINGYGEIKNTSTGFSQNENFVNSNTNVTPDNTNDALNNSNQHPNDLVDVTTIAPGLYQTGTQYQMLIMSWQELLDQELITVTNKGELSATVVGRTELNGDLMIPCDAGITKIASAFEDGFDDCKYLSGIYIPDSVTEISYNAFRGCFDLSYVRMPSQLQTIMSNAFRGCANLTQIIIPETVTKISNDPFGLCYNLVEIINLSSVTENLPTEHPYSGKLLFNYCTSLEESQLIYENGYVWMKKDDAIWLVNDLHRETTTLPSDYHGQLYSIADALYFWSQTIDTVIMNDNVTKVNKQMFNQSYIKNVVLSSNTTIIEPWGFGNCVKLESVTLPQSLQNIGEYAFGSCQKLKQIIIPSEVHTIGYDAFSYCNELQTIICYANTPPTCTQNYLSWSSSISYIVVPDDSIELYKTASGWKDMANKIISLSEYNNQQ